MKTKRFLLPLLLAVVIVGVSALAGFIHADSEAREAFGFALTGGATLPNGELKFGWERSDDAAELLDATAFKLRGDRFPEYFGGAFFSLEDHHYCVYLTDMSKKAELVKLLGSYADVVEFLPGKISYNRLSELVSELNSELLQAGIVATSVGIDTMNQQVTIAFYPEFYEQGKEYLEKHYKDNEFIRLEGAAVIRFSENTDGLASRSKGCAS